MKIWLKRGVLHLILACELALAADVVLILLGKTISISLFFPCLFGLWLLLLLTVRIDPRKLCVLAVAVPLVFAACGLSAFGVWKNRSKTMDYVAVDTGKSDLYGGKTVMAIVPHEDDDINIAGGVLEQYTAYGSEVYVVFITNGDFYGIGETRIAEALGAASFMGIPEDHVIFLGYGDQWKAGGPHIYNAGDNEAMVSVAGLTHTYATAEHPAYRENVPYTRSNLLADIRSVILEYRPDVILCSDYDFHVDHKAMSLLFEEAMGVILRENPAYTPAVLKGYAYNSAWNARSDFYARNILSTEDVFAEPYNQWPQTYRWEERVRMPVAADTLSRSLLHSKAYAAMGFYASQDAVKMASSVVNGDKVFWQRRTDSLLYTAAVETSSGAADLLRDFKLYDTKNVLSGAPPYDGTWIPSAEDAEKTVTVVFDHPRDVYEVVLYDHPSPEDNVLNAIIAFDNGAVLETGALTAGGSASSILMEQTDVLSFTITLETVEGTNAGLTEVEAFARADKAPFSFLKLTDEDGHFAYDYVMDASGRDAFSLYAFGDALPKLTAENYTLIVDNDRCTGEILDGVVSLRCPAGEACVLTLASREDPDLSDSIYVQNPNLWQRAGMACAQTVEQMLYEYDRIHLAESIAFVRVWKVVKSVL